MPSPSKTLALLTSSVRASSGFNRLDPFSGKRLMTDQELLVFTSKNVVCNSGDVVIVTESFAESKH